MHVATKTAGVTIDAANATHGTLVGLGIRAVVSIYALEVHAIGSLLADGLAGNHAEPFLVFDAQGIVVLVRACAVAGFPMAAAASDVVLIAELELFQLYTLLVSLL
jgi:hypothetical protein